MSKDIIISLSDEEYESIRAASATTHQTPEEVIVATLAKRFAPVDARLALSVENVLKHLRSQEVLVEPSADGSATDLPPRGTSERAQLEAEVEEALSDAFNQTGVDIVDLIERR